MTRVSIRGLREAQLKSEHRYDDKHIVRPYAGQHVRVQVLVCDKFDSILSDLVFVEANFRSDTVRLQDGFVWNARDVALIPLSIPAKELKVTKSYSSTSQSTQPDSAGSGRKA